MLVNRPNSTTGPKRALILGVAAAVASFQRFVESGMHVDVVVKDDILAQLAATHFGLRNISADSTTMSATILTRSSARRFLDQGVARATYDFVVVDDAFAGGVPDGDLVGVEGMVAVRKALKQNGIMSIVFVGANPSISFSSVAATVAYVFPHVRCFSENIPRVSVDEEEVDQVQSYVFIASPRKLTFRAATLTDLASSTSSRRYSLISLTSRELLLAGHIARHKPDPIVSDQEYDAYAKQGFGIHAPPANRIGNGKREARVLSDRDRLSEVEVVRGAEGYSALAYQYFLSVPFNTTADTGYISDVILTKPFPRASKGSADRGMLMLTIEPYGGLSIMTDQWISEIVRICALLNNNGVDVLLRYISSDLVAPLVVAAMVDENIRTLIFLDKIHFHVYPHKIDISSTGYPWGIQPILYKATFIRLANAIHTGATSTAMLWAPNIGTDYPFDAVSKAVNGTADFTALDTNGDGVVDNKDDPYEPFYPGDVYVDWVGMSLYWVGGIANYGNNAIPYSRFVYNSLHGLSPADGSFTNATDFFQRYVTDRNKPFALAETGAMYAASGSGMASELDIKRAMWKQLVTADALNLLPGMKAIFLYETTVNVSGIASPVDYSITRQTAQRTAFLADMDPTIFAWGSDYHSAHDDDDDNNNNNNPPDIQLCRDCDDDDCRRSRHQQRQDKWYRERVSVMAGDLGDCDDSSNAARPRAVDLQAVGKVHNRHVLLTPDAGRRPYNPIPYIFISLEALLYTSSILWLVDLLWSEPPDRTQPPIPKRLPTVDILIPCCGEPVELIKDTIKAALGQDYPRENFMCHICDDGGDDLLKDYVENELQKDRNLNITYIRRVKIKGVPHHFKAGNMNHALGVTHGEYVGVLDSDMIIAPNFLLTLVPYLYERTDVAFVQSPQAYYNIPAGDPLAHYTTMFYDIIMPWRDGRDSAPCVGTGMIFRRKALEDIGGFSIGTITEDFDTAIACQNKGWKSIYVNKKIQFGLVPDTLDATLKQRERWGIGTLQIFFKRNPMFMAGQLKFHQRAMYFSAGVSYLLPVALLAFIVMPFMTILFDWPIVPVKPGETKILMMFLGPWLLMNRVLFYSLYWGLPGGFQAHNRDPQLFIWMSPYYLVALLKYLIPAIATTFKVTNTAGNMASKNTFFTVQGIKSVWFHLLYLGASLGIFIWRATATDFKSCEAIFKFTFQAIFLIYNAQNMAPPVLFLMSPVSVDPDHVRTYDEYGIPHVRPEDCVPPTGKFVWMLEIIPNLLIFFCMAVLVSEAAGVTGKIIGDQCSANL
ncbi:hypothetical protein HDU93_006717 [Gonapodya sp. JEL0774]|nr:hypothetical protein HDU93_006717 [Gonapodya sp. JEL0774]